MHKIICIKLQKVWAICSVFVYLNQGHGNSTTTVISNDKPNTHNKNNKVMISSGSERMAFSAAIVSTIASSEQSVQHRFFGAERSPVQ